MAGSGVGSGVDTTQQWIYAELEIGVLDKRNSPIARVGAVIEFGGAYKGEVESAGRVINVFSHGERDFHGYDSVLELHLGCRSRIDQWVSLLLRPLLPF